MMSDFFGHHSFHFAHNLNRTTTNFKMVMELSYATISLVVDTWQMAKRTPAFEETAGTLILEKYVKCSFP